MVTIWASAVESSRRLVFAAFAFIALTFHLSPAIAGAACPDWTNVNENGNSPWIYKGTVADRPIRMLLQYDPKTREVTGSYGYNNQPGLLWVSGKLTADGASVGLDERGTQGRSTGHFDLEFTYDVATGMGPDGQEVRLGLYVLQGDLARRRDIYSVQSGSYTGKSDMDWRRREAQEERGNRL